MPKREFTTTHRVEWQDHVANIVRAIDLHQRKLVNSDAEQLKTTFINGFKIKKHYDFIKHHNGKIIKSRSIPNRKWSFIIGKEQDEE